MKFTDRIGVTKPTEVLQVDSMSAELRNSLWNVLLDLYDWKYWKSVVSLVARGFRKSQADDLPDTPNSCRDWLKRYFLGLSWGEAYNLIEFISSNHLRVTAAEHGVNRRHSVPEQELHRIFNFVLERESSGYRFVAGQLAPITNPSEVAAVQDAIAAAGLHGMRGAESHIAASVKMLGQKPTPDYRNAVKEAISAVESVAKQLTKQDGATLDQALKALTDKSAIHPALRGGFSKIYGYTSDADGIRHAMLDEPTVDFAEAKYMVVSCSAFVHYLIQKGDAAGLLSG